MRALNIKIYILLSFALCVNALLATEVYKFKTAGQGPNMFKQYSMCRNNANNGFVYAGTTKNTNYEDYIHISECNDLLNTTWSFKYTPPLGYTLNCTKIIKKQDKTGYWISGYLGNGTNDTNLHYPFIMEVDNIGNIMQQKIGNFQEAVFLDVEPTCDGGCIAVGFESKGIAEIERQSGRRGLIVKFNDTLGVIWSREFTSSYSQYNQSNSFYESAENVTVVNTPATGNLDYYFISGSVSSYEVSCNNLPTSTNLFMAYLDNNGSTQFMQTTLLNAVAFDASLDSINYSMYVVGKRDICIVTQDACICNVDLSTGTYSQILFEGSYTGFPFAHFLVPYKIEHQNDSLFIFGYVRAYAQASSVTTTDIMIPFTLKLLKSDYNAHTLEINHSNRLKTMNYPSEDPGFLNNWDANSTLKLSYHFPSINGPEPAVLYKHQNTRKWAMIGYFSVNNPPSPYVLHLFRSESARCTPFYQAIDWAAKSDPSDDLIMNPYNFTVIKPQIIQSPLNLDQSDCF